MNLKEIRQRKTQLAADILTLMERFKEDTGGFQIMSLKVNTVVVNEMGIPESAFLPAGVEITVEEV